MTVEILYVENVIENEIKAGMNRNDIALSYAFALRATTYTPDWGRINTAILGRWSPAGLKYIKERAWKIAEGQIKP